MNISQKIKMALTYKNMSLRKLADELNTTPQNLSQKLKRNSLNENEINEIAKILNATYENHFIFEDGTKI